MFRKIRIVLLLLSLSLTLSFMSNTYSRYVADTTGNLEVMFAKWQILVNDTDITSQNESSIELKPVVLENEYVADDTFAPSSQGYFDIAINPSNVSVSFDYNISLEVLNDNMPDLIITKYQFIDNKGNVGEETPIDTSDVVEQTINNAISQEMIFDKETENFKFEPFTIRIYFEWFEGEGEKQDDAADTLIGQNAALAQVEAVNNTESGDTTPSEETGIETTPDESIPVEETETETTTEEESEEVVVDGSKLMIKATIKFKQLLKVKNTETVVETETSTEVTS